MRRAIVRRWRRTRQRVTRAGQIGLSGHVLLIEAALQLALARIAISTLPFPKVARRLGGFMAPQQASQKAERAPLTRQDMVIAREIGWAVTCAARYVPFKAVCLPQAIAAHEMLRKRSIFAIIHFGTARGAALSLEAHAWLNAGDVEVTGYPVGAEFTEIACIA